MREESEWDEESDAGDSDLDEDESTEAIAKGLIPDDSISNRDSREGLQWIYPELLMKPGYIFKWNQYQSVIRNEYDFPMK